MKCKTPAAVRRPVCAGASLQRGGTLMGFVVGLLAGLGLALAVAVYVTRMPMPFVDRGVSRKPGQDLIEAERNKGWNPNASLNSKSGGSPASLPATPADTEGAIVVAPPGDGAAGPSPQSGASLDAPAVIAPIAPRPETASALPPASPPKAAAPVKSADPLGDLVQSRLGQGAASGSEAPAVDPFVYFVQAGAYRSADDAETQRARLAMLGVEASVTEREQSGRVVFRVRSGPFAQKTAADATREKLESSGIEAALVRVQR